MGLGMRLHVFQDGASSDCSWQRTGKHPPEPRADLKTCLSAVHVTETAVVKIVWCVKAYVLDVQNKRIYLLIAPFSQQLHNVVCDDVLIEKHPQGKPFHVETLLNPLALPQQLHPTLFE